MRITTLDLQDAGTPGDLITNVILASGVLSSTLGNTVADFGIRVRVIDKLTGEEVARDRATTDADGNWTLQLDGVADGVYKLAVRPRNDETGEPPALAEIRRFELDQSADAGRPATLAVNGTADDRLDPVEAAAVQFTVRGLDQDAAAQVVFTDDQGATITVDVDDGRFVVDLSSFDLGTVTSELRITDSLGNTATVAGNDVVICFYPGTMIATPDGPRAVETLVAGDAVRTADGAIQVIRWVGRQTVSTRFANPLRVLPVRIRAGALGAGLPVRDLLVSADHALLLDGLLVHAGALVNGVSIVREPNVPDIFTWWHIELDGHALILAEGVAAETFLDAEVARAFDNWAERPARAATPLAIPRVTASRLLPASLRARLAAALPVARAA